jgi:hypothetical protein
LKHCRLRSIPAALSAIVFLSACSGNATSSSTANSSLALPAAIRPAENIPPDSLFLAQTDRVDVYRNSGSDWTKTNEITEHVGIPLSTDIDQDDYLFVANSDQNDVALFKLAEDGKYIGSLTRDLKGPRIIALDAQGDLAVIADNPENNGTAAVIVFPFGGSNGSYVIKDEIANPKSLAYDSEGNLYVGNVSRDITVYAPGATTPMRKITDGISSPSSMVFDRNGRLYVGNYSGYNVTAYDPPDYNLVLTIPANLKTVRDIAIDRPMRHLYIAAQGSLRSEVLDYAIRTGKVTKITDGIALPSQVIICAKTYVCVKNASNTVTIYKNDALVHKITTSQALWSLTSR